MSLDSRGNHIYIRKIPDNITDIDTGLSSYNFPDTELYSYNFPNTEGNEFQFTKHR